MLFDIMNAPTVFQHLLTQVKGILDPLGGPGFVDVYIEDFLVCSKTLKEYFQNLRSKLREVNLKLNPDF